MKMMYNGTEIKSLNIKHYEMDTNSATVQPSDLQAGVTCFGRGKKITGTGKSFEFAWYGLMETNKPVFIPSNINVIEIASLEYPVKLSVALTDMKNTDFAIVQTIGSVAIDSVLYDLTVQAKDNIITISCNHNISLQVFYGKDNYV